MRRALGLVAYAFGLVAFFEGASRLALRSDAFFRRVAGDDDATWRLRWARRHAKQGALYYSFDAWSPTRGWALRPGLRDVPAFGGKRLNSNSKGIRGRREYAYAKPPGVVRVLVLGDSFTFGEDVGDDETYSHYLERSLPGVEVLNMGVHGYGHDQMLLYFQEEGVRYRPDAVVLGFLPDDMERNLLSFRDYAKPRFVLEGGALRLTGSPVPAPDAMLRAEPWRSRLFDVLTMLRERHRARSGAKREEMRRLTLAILDELRRAIEAAGARPAYAYLPAYGEITRMDPGMTERERFFFSYCRRRNIQSIYLAPFFRARVREGVELKGYGHWGPTEHRVAAEGIRAYLLEKGVIRLPSS
jgi:hypothetical protein